MWSNGNLTSTKNISINSTGTYGMFVTTMGDIYIDTYNSFGGVSKWTLNSTTTVLSIPQCRICRDLFVDVSNTLYCALESAHQIITKSLDSISSPVTIVAGTGAAGDTSYMLSNPRGIFVNINFDLYVADTFNNRIQLFRSGESNGITVAGSSSSVFTISLNQPNSVILDATNYLFIADNANNRIVGSGPNGFRCIVGCSGLSGAASNQLSSPESLQFDSYGNLFVIDSNNNRIQKFMLMTNSCSKSNNSFTIDSTNTFLFV